MPLFSNKDLKQLIVPLLIEQVLSVSIGMFDVVMISSLGEAAVSGVSLVDMINVLMLNLFAALATGGAVVAAQMLGAHDRDGACDSARQLIFIALILSLASLVPLFLLRHVILRLFFGSIAADVMHNALIYYCFSLASYPFIALYHACAALFRAMGNAKVSMMISFFSNLLNIAGNALFIFVFHWGVAGAAAATLISRAGAAAATYFLLKNPLHEIHIDAASAFRPKGALIRRILYIGIPNGLETSLFQLGRVLVVSMISGFGTVQIAANAVANNFDSLGCIPGQALSLAMITVVGQCVGARDLAQASHYAKKLTKLAYLFTGGVNALILLSLPLTLRFYHLSAETLRLSALLILIHDGCAILLWPAAFTLPSALRAANDVRFTMVISIFSMWTFRILFSYIIGVRLGMGALGVWLSMVLDWIFRAAAFIFRFHRGGWKKYALRTE